MWVCVIIAQSRVQSRDYRYCDVVVVSEVIWSKENCNCWLGTVPITKLAKLRQVPGAGISCIAN